LWLVQEPVETVNAQLMSMAVTAHAEQGCGSNSQVKAGW
jgi:hypothetical protein